MKQSKRQQEIAAREASDVTARAVGREDIDYGSDELPSAPRGSVLRVLQQSETLERRLKRLADSVTPSPRTLKFRTPARCQNGHFRFLFYSVKFGVAVECKWDESYCGCPTGELMQGFKKHGDEQQFTGLHDKDGKELFEGDTVDHSKYHDRYVVEWSTNSAGFIIRSDKHTCALSALCQEYLEIVGHIYE